MDAKDKFMAIVKDCVVVANIMMPCMAYVVLIIYKNKLSYFDWLKITTFSCVQGLCKLCLVLIMSVQYICLILCSTHLQCVSIIPMIFGMDFVSIRFQNDNCHRPKTKTRMLWSKTIMFFFLEY